MIAAHFFDVAVHTAATSEGNGLYDEAAMLGAITAAIVSIVTLIRQGRHRRATEGNTTALDRIENTLNHTDQEITTPDGPQTLGQRVVAVQKSQVDLEETVTEGFRRNDETHASIIDTVHQIGARADQIRADVNTTNERISKLHPESQTPSKETS